MNSLNFVPVKTGSFQELQIYRWEPRRKPAFVAICSGTMVLQVVTNRRNGAKATEAPTKERPPGSSEEGVAEPVQHGRARRSGRKVAWLARSPGQAARAVLAGARKPQGRLARVRR
jgi:hypothetical protein